MQKIAQIKPANLAQAIWQLECALNKKLPDLVLHHEIITQRMQGAASEGVLSRAGVGAILITFDAAYFEVSTAEIADTLYIDAEARVVVDESLMHFPYKGTSLVLIKGQKNETAITLMVDDIEAAAEALERTSGGEYVACDELCMPPNLTTSRRFRVSDELNSIFFYLLPKSQ